MVGGWDKRKRNQQNAFAILQRFGPAYLENCTIARKLDAVAGEVFGWVKSTSTGSSKIGFSSKREKGQQQETPKSGLVCWNGQVQHIFRAPVIGCPSRDFMPMTCLKPLLVRATEKLSKHHTQNFDANGGGERSYGDSSRTGTKRSCPPSTRESMRRSKLRREGVWHGWNNGRTQYVFHMQQIQ